MRNVAALLYGLVPLWCGRLVFPVAPVGDFAATHAVWVSPRNRQEVTIKRWRAEPPTMREMLKLSRTHERVRPESARIGKVGPFRTESPFVPRGVQSYGQRKSIESIFASQSSVLNRYCSSCPYLHTTIPRVLLHRHTEEVAVA